MENLTEFEKLVKEERDRIYEEAMAEEERKRTVEINIVDAICGSGKTSAAINMINASDDEQRFLYITPYLDEVNRIIDCCPKKKFRQPVENKLEKAKALINKYNLNDTSSDA